MQLIWWVFFSGLFVDVGENMSVLDRINLTFVYDEIGLKGKSSEEEENAVSFFKVLNSQR